MLRDTLWRRQPSAVHAMMARTRKRIEVVAAGIAAMGDLDSVTKAVGILAEKFSSIDAIGQASVALDRRAPLRSPEADRVKALAFARVDQLLRRLPAAP
jgi:hypothetical protein